jgi:hypothetical protein
LIISISIYLFWATLVDVFDTIEKLVTLLNKGGWFFYVIKLLLSYLASGQQYELKIGFHPLLFL